MAHPSRSLRRSLGEGDPAPAPGRGRRQAQGNDNAVAGGAASRPVQRLAAAHPATTITRLASAQRPGPEVYFPQEHPPGREAQIDFTHCNSLGVTVGGRAYRHRLFQLVLSHSGWRYAEVATGETCPGPEAGATERPVGAGRCASGDPLGQHLGRHPRDEAQPRQGPERQLRRFWTTMGSSPP